MIKYIAIFVVFVSIFMSSCTAQVDSVDSTEASAEMKETDILAQQTQETILDMQIEAKFINDTPEKFEAAMQSEHLLLDVRTQAEYDQGHINDPVLIPVDELEGRLDEIAQYKNIPVLVYCRSGNRSLTASNILLENGFTEVHNLLGGIGAWNEYKK